MNLPHTPNSPVWQIETTHPELVDVLKDGFREINDPEIHMNIIQLGLIRDVSIDPYRGVIVKMILTTPFCPYGPAMIETAQKKAEEVLNQPVKIDLLMDMWDFSMMEDPSEMEWGF